MPRYIKVESAAPSPRTARYSHAVEFNGLLHITGQLPIGPTQPDAALPGTIGEEADLVFLNLSIIAEESGFSLSNCIFARIYLRNFEQDYAGFNAVYDRYFPDADRLPARTTVGVAMLGRNALVEVDLVVGQSGS
ncbi:reactive intermediate/imine deaminase [Mesorhizobium shonense]|uniref:Reactive intermediate/imine deaminase n=1 Tax=Mesorhizobium shonense TaxID=1209948 RepID=A0ABV2HXH0_9HYPH